MRHSSFALASGFVTSLVMSLSGAALAQDASPASAPATPAPGGTTSTGVHHHHHRHVWHKGSACHKGYKHHHHAAGQTAPAGTTPAPATPAPQ